MKKYLLLVATLILASVMLAVSASAEITLSYDLSTETVEGETLSVVTATLVDPDSVGFEIFYNEISFDNTMIIPADYEYGTAIESTDPADLLYSMVGMVSGRNKATVIEPSWKVDGATTTFEFDSYYNGTKAVSAATDLEVFKFYFVFADGKSAEDFTSDSFVVKRVLYQDDNVLHGCKYNEYNDMVVTNNVVPEAPAVVAITVPVLAGDKIYLQDGTVVTAATEGDYEVSATVGYVAVNTGKTSQKTYYVDGTSATLVHTNGIVSTEENNLRGPDETSSVATDTSGLRFLMNHNPENRAAEGHEITEIGVLMTVESNKVLGIISQETIDNLKVTHVSTGAVKSGYALGNGYDRVLYKENDNNWVISAVMYNINLTENNVKANIVCRPFYKVGDTYIYGETMKNSLYEVAKEIKEGGYVGCTDELKAYVDEIIELVDGVETPIVEDEVIIDISGLYGM